MNIGIDIGTTYSACSYIDVHDKLIIVQDPEFKSNTTPSVVYLGKQKCLVGQAALDKLAIDPECTLCWLFKRSIGTTELLAYDEDGNEWIAEGLTALLIKKLINDAELKAEKKVTGVTITVPVHFDIKQRSAIISAVKIAGISKIEIIDEPVAASIYYGYSQLTVEQEKKILVFDLGGGTFDVTILLLNESGFFTLASHGDNKVGGQDIDRIIMTMISESLSEKNISIHWNSYNSQLLRKQAEKIKIEMSRSSYDYDAHVFLSGWSGTITISRELYQKKVYDFFDKCFDSTSKCLEDAGIAIVDIDEHLFVGGSSKNPFLLECYKNYFDTHPEKMSSLNPDLAVAYGASLYGQRNILKESLTLPELRGVMGYNLALKTYNAEASKQELEIIVAKNSPLPTINKRILYKSYKEQDYIRLEFVSFQESEIDFTEIGSLQVGPLRKTKHQYELELSIKVLKDGMIKADIIDLQTGDEINQSFSYLKAFDEFLVKQKLVLDTMLINSMQ